MACWPSASSPDFAIVGTQKGGTTSLTNIMMVDHPLHICVDHEQRRTHVEQRIHNISWDDVLLPARSRCQRAKAACSQVRVGFVDPLLSYLAPSLEDVSGAPFALLLHRAAPSMKLVFLVREPIQRAFSQYNMHKLKKEPGTVGRDFGTLAASELRDLAVADEARMSKRRPTDIVRRGLYAEQLDALLRWYSLAQILIVISEHLNPLSFVEPSGLGQMDRMAEYNRLFAFIGVPELARLHTQTSVEARRYVQHDEAIGNRTILPAACFLQE